MAMFKRVSIINIHLRSLLTFAVMTGPALALAPVPAPNTPALSMSHCSQLVLLAGAIALSYAGYHWYQQHCQRQAQIKTLAAIAAASTSTATTTQDQIVVAMDLHGTVLAQHNSMAFKTWGALPWHTKLTYFPKFMGGVLDYAYKKARHQPVAGIEHHLLADTDSPEYAQIVTNTVSCFQPLPGADQLLSELKSAGIKVFAFSNIGPRSYEQLMQQYPQVMTQFDGRIILEKPDTPRKNQGLAYQRCAQVITAITGKVPTKIIFFDDNLSNLQLAHAVDQRFIPVLCQSKTAPQIAISRTNFRAIAFKS